MGTQTMDSLHQDVQRKQDLLKILTKIASSADCGLHYSSQYSTKELEKKLDEIAKLATIK